MQRTYKVHYFNKWNFKKFQHHISKIRNSVSYIIYEAFKHLKKIFTKKYQTTRNRTNFKHQTISNTKIFESHTFKRKHSQIDPNSKYMNFFINSRAKGQTFNKLLRKQNNPFSVTLFELRVVSIDARARNIKYLNVAFFHS